MSNPWLINVAPNPQAKCRLFCFHYAGGGASVFRRWANKLPDSIELFAIQMPGREERFAEPPVENLVTMTAESVNAIRSYLNKPFALFGHSLGGRVAYEVAYALLGDGLSPQHLIISATRAPEFPRETNIYQLPDKQFIEAISKNNGIPDVILQDDDMMQLLLPRIRADYRVIGTMPVLDPNQQIKLNCPIATLGGQNDSLVNAKHLAAWRYYTNKPFSEFQLSGDHFFINSKQHDVLEVIKNILK